MRYLLADKKPLIKMLLANCIAALGKTSAVTLPAHLSLALLIRFITFWSAGA